MAQARKTIDRIGLALIDDRQAEVAAELKHSISSANDAKSIQGRDLLSLLIRSNLASEPAQRMSVQETLCQITTFIAAGHETTASALTWCLYALAKSPVTQRKLRASLLSLPSPPPISPPPPPPKSSQADNTAKPSESPSAPTTATLPSSSTELQRLTYALSRLPYLDWVVRESLRLHSPVSCTMRVCTRETDLIPVAEPFLDRKGVLRSAITVSKGDIVIVPVQAVNKSRRIWGDDACDFRPERWEKPPKEVKAVPGVYSNILTFLHGNRSCIGYKFALLEIKIFLYVLLRDIEFSIDPTMVIEKKVNVVTRPFVKSEPHLGNQLPLQIRPVSDDEVYDHDDNLSSSLSSPSTLSSPLETSRPPSPSLPPPLPTPPSPSTQRQGLT